MLLLFLIGVDVAPLKLNRTFRLFSLIVPSLVSLLYLPYNLVKSEFEHESSSCKYDGSNFVDLAFDFFDLVDLFVRLGVENESFDSE